MAYWKRSLTEFEKMHALICQFPGIRMGAIARMLGVARSTVTRRMPSLEEAGYLFSEDANGGLWHYKVVARKS